MTKTRFLALVTALALLLIIPATAFAQNAIPHQFIGTAMLDGVAVVDGTAVTAWVGGEQVAATNVSGGQYSLQVGGASGFAGETVMGERRDISTVEGVKAIGGDLFVPISTQEIIEGLREQGLTDGAITAGLNMLGISSQVFGNEKKTKTRSAEEVLESSQRSNATILERVRSHGNAESHRQRPSRCAKSRLRLHFGP